MSTAPSSASPDDAFQHDMPEKLEQPAEHGGLDQHNDQQGGGPVPVERATRGPPPHLLPRSAASIAYALDLLDRDLEAEEEGEEDEHAYYSAGVPCGDTLPPDPCTVSAPVDSHPLDFIAQFQHITIVTTAALPWLTGTAVNPALRAAYLWHAGHSVSLLIPFVSPADQPRLFPDGMIFPTPESQAPAVVESIQRRVPFSLPNILHMQNAADHEDPGGPQSHPFRLIFYPGRYDSALGSIIPEADLQPLVPLPVSLIVLEEPEHLTWYHTGRRWTRAFPRHVPVVGVMHTNYVDYARRMAGDTAAGTLRRLNQFLCRQHTHKVIKLSDAVQELPRQETCFVHGVSHAFLAVGDSISELRQNGENNKSKQEGSEEQSIRLSPIFTKGAYFLGKALWAKGFGELVDRCSEHKDHCEAEGRDADFIDVYGMGPQLEAIKQEVDRRGLSLRFMGAKDHLSPDITAYRTFVNPSTSDVVATTSAEALAMGKWLVVPQHPCNDFFSTFQNCLVYDSPEEFSAALERTFVEEPAPLNDEERRRLTWEAATDRFLHCCASVEVARGTPLARVAAKTGWVGYNVGYQVYQVANVAIELVQRALVDAGEGRTGQRTGRNVEVASHPLDLEAYPSTLSDIDPP